MQPLRLRSIEDVLTGAWQVTDVMVNGAIILKKVDQELFIWYTADGPMWYISNAYVEDGKSWQNLGVLGRIADVDKSPSGDIFIPVTALHLPSGCWLERFETLQGHSQQLSLELDKSTKENEGLLKENELELHQYEMIYGKAVGCVKKTKVII